MILQDLCSLDLDLDPFFHIISLQLTPPQVTHLLLLGEVRDESQDSRDPSSHLERRNFASFPMVPWKKCLLNSLIASTSILPVTAIYDRRV
jgi:hypothetical protein